MQRKLKKQIENLEFQIKFYEDILKKKPNFIQALVALGDNYSRSGRFKDGLDVDKRLTALRPDDPVIWYNLACSYSLLNDIESSLQAIRKSLELGYEDFALMEKDSDLYNLRNDQRFRELALYFKKIKNE